MKQTTIENHTHINPSYNCTHMEAWMVGYAISRWTRWNVLYWFRPVKLEAVAIVPMDVTAVDPEDQFDPRMFSHGQTFEHIPLNHYVRVQLPGSKNAFFINAGNLLREFHISPKQGYRALKELIKRAKKEFATNPDAPEGSTYLIQEEGADI